MNEAITENDTSDSTAKLIYILYIIGPFFGPLGIVGVIMAYMNISEAPDWLKSHYQFQIRTFWIGAIYIVTGAILTLALVGIFILLFWAVWLIVRSVKGMQLVDSKESHPNPTGWLF